MQVKYEPWSIKKEDKDVWGIRILEGKFSELTIAINDINVNKDENNSVALDYDVVYSLIPANELENDPEFSETMSFVIQDVLVKAMNEYENRNNNPAESS